MKEQEILALAERFVAGIESGDIAEVKACYAPDAKIWHNFDNVDQSVEDNLKVLGWMSGVLQNRKYNILRRAAIPGGVEELHGRGVICAERPQDVPRHVDHDRRAGARDRTLHELHVPALVRHTVVVRDGRGAAEQRAQRRREEQRNYKRSG